jgi:hypothetical protein
MTQSTSHSPAWAQSSKSPKISSSFPAAQDQTTTAHTTTPEKPQIKNLKNPKNPKNPKNSKKFKKIQK